MKRIKIGLITIGLTIALLAFPSLSMAQVELTPFGGIMFNGKIKFIEGDLKFSDQASYGVILGIPIRHGVIAELSYTRSESVASWRPNPFYGTDFPQANFGVNINYFQVGAIKQAEIKPDFYGFGGLTLGAAYYNTTQQSIQDLWRFAIGVQAGLKYFFNDHIGIRVQGRMLFPIYGGGAGVYCGIGTGGSSCGLSVGGSSLILQGDITGGLVFRFGQ
ncbi:MAG TPA: hypothetical protein VK994_01200 [Bacteroidales bacterium]|nr:hypothetical protein [Bacteroidales bacterium]